MEGIVSLLILLAFLGGGMVCAKSTFAPKPKGVTCIIAVILRILLLFMGIRIGRLGMNIREVQTIGLLGLVFGIATIFGTVLFLIILNGLSGGNESKHKRGRSESRRPSPKRFLWESLGLFSFVIVGIVAGKILPFASLIPNEAGTWTLYCLLFFIGMQMMQSDMKFVSLLRDRRMLLLPLVTASGSICGGIVVSPLFHLSVGEAAALSAGFGWYSLSGVLISDLGNPLLGSAAFLVNLVRESLALFMIPLLGGLGLPHLAIGVGGATSMDVTLPLVETSCGAGYVPLSIAHGALLSLLVPFLVPFFWGFA